MDVQSADELKRKKCDPCHEGLDPCPAPLATEQLEKLPGWYLTNENQRIRKDWKMKNFLDGLAFFEAVGKVAEEEAHHPDLHLESYRDLSIEIWTHDIDGLSENDFILAAKIDAIEMK